MKNWWGIIGVGFALFSMFFGSGNLVFPLLVGVKGATAPLSAALGILLSGVVLPFLGVFAMLQCQGDHSRFFSCLGNRGRQIFTFCSLGMMGPFGVLARCLTVMHGGVEAFVPGVALISSSLAFVALIFLLCLKRDFLMRSIGGLLTPLLLGCIALLFCSGFVQTTLPAMQLRTPCPFIEGFFQGYQTMDLLAALFFSTFILQHLERLHPNEPRTQRRIFIGASFVGGGLLSFVYTGLVYLGAHYHHLLGSVEPQRLLITVAQQALGNFGGVLIAVTSILACLTTAVVLTYLFADWLQKHWIYGQQKLALLVTLLIAFLISTLKFSGISAFLGPILEITYPFIIGLTAWNLFLSAKETRILHRISS